ncbi:MAG: hypothetical protein ACREMN_10685 [Gemmatimonadales bacterium]
MAYIGDRPDGGARAAIDQLETILREVAEELAGWRARAQKAEAELKARGNGGGPPNPELESENKLLRQRVEGARRRVGELLQRLTFLEEQAGTK